jgi:hypothetical protein
MSPIVLMLTIPLVLGLSYRRARGELRAWQGWGSAFCYGWLFLHNSHKWELWRLSQGGSSGGARNAPLA